ncbi:hypothetical protein ACVWY6_003982 [Williamsia sp. R60]
MTSIGPVEIVSFVKDILPIFFADSGTGWNQN